jgi:hypothetical protein
VITISQAQELIKDLAGHPGELQQQTRFSGLWEQLEPIPDHWEQCEPRIVVSPVTKSPFQFDEEATAVASEVNEQNTSQEQDEIYEQIKPSIICSPASEPPFELNEEAVAVANEVQIDEEQSREKLNQAYESLADIIRNYPDTEAAEDACKMLHMAGLCVSPNGKLVPNGFYYSNR